MEPIPTTQGASSKQQKAESKQDTGIDTTTKLIEMMSTMLQNQLRFQVEVERRRAEEKREERDQRQQELQMMLQAFQVPQGFHNAQAPNHPSHLPIQSTMHANLPKVQLPSFNGELLDWPHYWESFAINVDGQSSLSDKQKLDYLFQTLRGSALDEIKGLGLQGDRYADAVGILKATYGDVNSLIEANWRALRSIPSMKEGQCNVEKFLDEARAGSTALVGMGVDPKQLDAYVGILFDKLPGSMQEEFQKMRLVQGKLLSSCSMDDFMAMLFNFQQLQKLKVPKKEKKGDAHEERGTSGNLGTSNNATFYQTSSPSKENKYPCIFCGKTNHFSDECRTVADPSEREEIAKRDKRCFRCLGTSHMSKNCRKNKSCYYCKQKGHNSAFCYKRSEVIPKQSASTANSQLTAEMEESQGRSESTSTSSMVQKSTDNAKDLKQDAAQTTHQLAHLALTNEEDGIIMATFSGVRKNPENCKSINLYVYLDAGARFTCISKRDSEALGLKHLKEVQLQTASFNTTEIEKVKAKVVSLVIGSKNGPSMSITAYSIAQLASMLSIHPVKFSKSGWEILKRYSPLNVPPKVSTKRPIDVLLGMDYYYSIMGPKVAKTIYVEGNVVVHVTPMDNILAGNTLQGPGTMNGSYTIPNLLCYTETEDVPNLWNLDVIGIKDPSDTTVIKKGEEQPKFFRETTLFENGRYYLKWPWKSGNPTLPTNFYTARYRLQRTLDTLQSTQVNTREFKLYNDIFEDQIKKGVIEPVESREPTPNLVHYIAHFPVIRKQSATTKVRIVYDASAKTKPTGLCLNDLIYKGPNYLEDIAGLLLRFRIPKIALLSDVEKAFLQVGLQEAHRDVTRLLSLKDPQRVTLQDNIQVYRFTRVPFGIVASPFLLGATIDLHLERNSCAVADLMRRNMYMDNIFVAAQSTEEAMHLYKQGKELFQQASMNLREWISNDQQFNYSLPEADKIKDAVTKVLGLTWNTISDKVSIRVPQDPVQVVNKRMILHQVAKI